MKAFVTAILIVGTAYSLAAQDSVSSHEDVERLPPEKLPQTHVDAPGIYPGVQVEINLEKSGCFGPCSTYAVTISNNRIDFDGHKFVVAAGHHTARIDREAVMKLVQRFIDDGFYSMDREYIQFSTGAPEYTLSISIDGVSKPVVNCNGERMGMPHVISELENEVLRVAGIDTWVKGYDGLVQRLRDESFDFTSEAAQHIMKRALLARKSETVKQLIAAGVKDARTHGLSPSHEHHASTISRPAAPFCPCPNP